MHYPLEVERARPYPGSTFEVSREKITRGHADSGRVGFGCSSCVDVEKIVLATTSNEAAFRVSVTVDFPGPDAIFFERKPLTVVND